MRTPEVGPSGQVNASSDPRVVVLGPAHERPGGGIAVALGGFLAALENQGLLHAKIDTQDVERWGGTWRVALEAHRKLAAALDGLCRSGREPVVYAHVGGPTSMLRKAGLLRLARRRGARTLVHLHSALVDRMIETAPGRLALGAVLALADRVVVLTPYWAARIRWAGIDRPMVVVPDPLPPFAETVARRGFAPPPPHDGLRVLAMSHLMPGKGIDTVIRALRHVSDHARLVVAGEGPSRQELEELALGIGVADRVEFVGWVSGQRKTDLLLGSDVFCLPSVYDSFGMGFIEAMACGRPVVAARYRATPDVVPAGEAGLLVSPGDPVATAEALARLCDAGLRERLGRQARRWALQRYSVAAIGARLAEAVS